ncbi:hypothetical protein CCACVL1_00259 [Corchorus capsularis]|uniref:Uncharacterized protein n=1 Tax=Corchorus capsularis TaxID=210143 RepID=A0A1R3KXI0_COCAP|nr:hypothetical protein CCACVL1_00259 [Corchorus capsularis]
MLSSKSLSSKSIFTTSFCESEWKEEIKAVMKNSQQAKEVVVVSVFEVSEALRSVKPEAYTPQLLAFGPYHHFKPKLYQMQRFKVAAYMKAQSEWLGNKVDFALLAGEIMEQHESSIRTCYQTHLDIDQDTLAYLMAIDGLALLKLVHSSISYYKTTHKTSPKNPFDDFHKSSCPDLDMILRDILMLENQIPMLLLKPIAEKCNKPDHKNLQYFVEFIEAISPLQIDSKVRDSDVVNYKHLLDLFYQLLCPKQDGTDSSDQLLRPKEDGAGHVEIQIHESVEKMDDSSAKAPLAKKKKKSSKAPDCSVFRNLLASLPKLRLFRKSGEKVEEANVSSSSDDHPPPDCTQFRKFLDKFSQLRFPFAALPEKIVNLFLTSLELLGISAHDFFDKDRAWIPTASQLVKTGVTFSVCGGIKDIKFNKETLVLELPVITLNAKRDQDKILNSKRTTEVILRNLIAFESLSKDRSQSLPFTRYTQLMNGLIDNDKDANVLKGALIIKGDLASVEIANLFNGLSETIEPKDRDINIDKAIKKINRYYDNTLRVKTNKLLKKYIYSSWRFLTFLTSFLLLAMIFLETFCGFYECKTVRFKS